MKNPKRVEKSGVRGSEGTWTLSLTVTKEACALALGLSMGGLPHIR